MADLELDDIQGIIFSGYGHLPNSAYLFLHIDDPAGALAWLGGLVGQVTTSAWKTGAGGAKEKPEVSVNVAFTAPGLRALGLKGTSIDTFPPEFVEGMALSPRPRRLGDTGASAPERWEFGGPTTPAADEIHALLILQAPDRPSLDALCAAHDGPLKAHGIREVVTPRQYARQDSEEPEHFGFRDSISQPAIAGSPNTSKKHQSCVAAGEFILGYDNEYKVLPQGPTVEAADDPANLLEPYDQDPKEPPAKDLGRNGTYLVFRKLAQDVAGFRRFLRDNSSGPDDMAHLGAKLMGRWAGGAPLALADHDDPALAHANDFGYAKEDPYGLRCPMGAHMRRTNPRDLLVGSPEESQKVVNRHRIVRRGVIYGDRLPPDQYEDDGTPRGLLFLCINADIERQFEFIQQTWANSPKFGGLYTDSDPITGPNADPPRPGRHRALDDDDPRHRGPPPPLGRPPLRHRHRRRQFLPPLDRRDEVPRLARLTLAAIAPRPRGRHDRRERYHKVTRPWDCALRRPVRLV